MAVRNLYIPFWSLLLMVLVMASCVPDSDEATLEESLEESSTRGLEDDSDPGITGCIEIDRTKTIRVANGIVELRPAIGKYRGDLLILPAWGQPRDAWCHRSDFCQTAVEKGYRLIMPEMGKSIYIDQAYAETREDWRATPSYQWLRDSVIPELQEKYCMLEVKGANFIIGLSSGARGVVKLLSDDPNLFTAGAALSGDYDPSQLIGDNIYNGFLGKYEDHAERWETTDNLIHRAGAIRAPLYLGHGTEDPMIPFTQTQSFYDALLRDNPDLTIKLNLASGLGESFAYWNTEGLELLNFFEDTQANRPETP